MVRPDDDRMREGLRYRGGTSVFAGIDMASIQSLGIGSGLLTSELLDDLIAAERAPAENRLNTQQAVTEAKISAYGEMRSTLAALEASLQGLTLASTFNSNTATSTDES